MQHLLQHWMSKAATKAPAKQDSKGWHGDATMLPAEHAPNTPNIANPATWLPLDRH
jgi:hypothetical protein